MKKNQPRMAVLSAIALVIMGTVVGCAAAPALPETKPTPQDTAAKPVEKAESKPAQETPSESGDVPVLAPGESTTGTGAVPFVKYDGKKAVFAHKLVSIEKAPAADVEQLVEKSSQLKGMDIWYLRVESHYVSGDDLASSSIYSPLVPVTASKKRAQDITLIGWESCATDSVPSPGNDPSVIIENCRAAVAAPAGDAPVGMAWSDSDSGYDIYDGKAAYFYLP